MKADEGGPLKSQEVQGGKLRGKRGWKTFQRSKGIGDDVMTGWHNLWAYR